MNVTCPVVFGREAELAELTEALDASLSGEGRLVFLTGEAGIGKSRLAREILVISRFHAAFRLQLVEESRAGPQLPTGHSLRRCCLAFETEQSLRAQISSPGCPP